MKALITFGLLSFFITSFAQTSNKFELIDVFDLEYISDPQISPDGEKIVYVRNFSDIMTDKNLSNLWIINFDGTENRPLTTGNQKDTYPRWSNDGTRIIYKSDRDGITQLYLRWITSNYETKLTNVQSALEGFNWSYDDEYIAFNMFVPNPTPLAIKLPAKPQNAKWNAAPIYIDKLKYRADGQGYLEQGNKQLFTMLLTGGTPRQITSSSHDHGIPVWSKDGNWLFFPANLSKESEYSEWDTEIYRISIQTREIDELTTQEGADSDPVISPDGKQLAYLGFNDTYPPKQITKLFIMDINGDNKKCISKDFDRDVQEITWTRDGKGLYFRYDDKGDTKLAHITLDGKVTDLTNNLGGLHQGQPYNRASFSVTHDGKYAYTMTNVSHPADLAVGEKSVTKRLTYLNDDLFNHKKLGEVEEIWFKSSYDNQDIQGWILKPPGFDPDSKYPLILEIHGGPYNNYGPRFSTEMQFYAASGYLVLYTNFRGSTSYGQEFCDLIGHHNMDAMYQDLMSGVDAVIKRDYVDENNLFVTGGSYGGYLTAWIVGSTNRFNAAVAAKPIINQFSCSLYMDIVDWATKWFSDYPWKVPEEYFKSSPISLVNNVVTPTMIISGEQDYRCPIAEAEQFYTALKLNKIDAALVRIPNSSHNTAAKPSILIAKVAAVLSWFEKYTKHFDDNE